MSLRGSRKPARVGKIQLLCIMTAQTYFWITLILLIVIVVVTDLKFGLLRDCSTADNRSYSFARVQLTWWTVIILASMVSTIVFTGQIPTFNSSTLILLGISSTTLATATAIDVSDQARAESSNTIKTLSRNQPSSGFLLDILSDNSGISIHRFQTVAFNFVFGCWMVARIVENLANVNAGNIDGIIPVIEPNNLILIGLSSATYAALKTTENKQSPGLSSEMTNPENAEEQPVG